MNDRERFVRYMNYQKTDRIPFFETGPWITTLRRWYREGLPVETDFDDFFNFDKREMVPIDFLPIPRFISEILEETDRYRIWKDETGIIKKDLRKSVSMPYFIKYPVENREDWERLKKRFDPDDLRRYPKNWSEELIEYYKKTEHILWFGPCFPVGGFFAFPRYIMGLEKLIVSYFRDPNWIHEILDFWVDFIIEASKEVLKQVKIDYFLIHEDMAYKKGPIISPKFFEEFMLPRYKKLTSCLRHHGIDIIIVDSDGYIEPLIPLFLEGGVNGLEPLEVAAGMDALQLRKKYGINLRLKGNIDKRVLVIGREAIEKEVDRVLPLMKDGGYIPHIDHGIPDNVPFENYVYYVKSIKKYLWSNA